MRKIEFRGKAILYCGFIETGEWFYGSLVSDRKGCYIVSGAADVTDEYFRPEEWYTVDPETVGKFTGLEDKNGVKIFEGDIVKCQSSIMTPSISKVKGAVEDYLILAYPDEEKYSVPFSWQFSEPDIAEVIGNIYDNSDLLKYEEEQNGTEHNESEAAK